MDKPLIYVCSPYGGREENYRAALTYGRYVISRGGLPVIPHTMLHGILDDADPEARAAGLALGQALLRQCDEVWVFGRRGGETAGMSAEITTAEHIGKTVRYISDPLAPNERSAAIAEICRRYEELTGGFNRMMIEDIGEYLSDGLSPELITAAIETAVRKEVRSPWAYSRKICERCRQQRILTLEQFQRQTSPKSTPAREQKASYNLEYFEYMLAHDGDDNLMTLEAFEDARRKGAEIR